ncbi:MAG: hypothetical protein KGZ25_07895, partial [Planctomycetes bacterium]|nr:hypothetical protein [Planctomycetota bacterium]
MNDRLDLTKATNGVYVLSSFTGKPEGDYGVLEEMGLNLPPTNSIIYYTAFQRHDPVRQAREDEVIGGGANRVQGLRITRWDETIEGGLFAILKLTDGDWLVLLPITGEKAMSWLDPVDPQSVKLKIGTLGTAPVEGDLPVFAYFRAPDLYEACSGAWREALDHSLMRGFARLRNEKRYPIIFQYLGWCSWEQHKRQIDANILTDAARRINAHDLPIRFLLIDDGYHCHTGSDSPVKDQLVRLGPNPDTFPDGWGPILEQRREDGIRWFGLWENFNGYWQRIAADNQLGETVNSHLMEVPEGGLMPGSTLPDAIAWYEG